MTGAATNEKGTVSVTGVTDKTARTTLNIGATVKIGGVTYRITSIGTSAFAGAARLRSVKMGANITTIGAKEFLNCKALSNMEISTKSLSMNRTGNNAFKGIKFNCTVKVPKQNLFPAKLQTFDGNITFLRSLDHVLDEIGFGHGLSWF